MNKGSILSVDDDEDLQTVIGEYLEGDGYNVASAYKASEALSKIENADYDAILLDLTLPDGEGLSLIQQFQSQTKAPIIVVSGKTETTERIICLEMGADDYLTKPFEMRELSARIKAVLRRVETVEQDIKPQEAQSKDAAEQLYFNDMVLDRAQYQAFDADGHSLDLTTGEFQMLEALLLAPNRALSREHLFEITRGGTFDAYDRAIDIQIARIRKKLGDDDESVIKTVRGVGYMFRGDMKKAAE